MDCLLASDAARGRRRAADVSLQCCVVKGNFAWKLLRTCVHIYEHMSSDQTGLVLNAVSRRLQL